MGKENKDEKKRVEVQLDRDVYDDWDDYLDTSIYNSKSDLIRVAVDAYINDDEPTTQQPGIDAEDLNKLLDAIGELKTEILAHRQETPDIDDIRVVSETAILDALSTETVGFMSGRELQDYDEYSSHLLDEEEQ